MRVRRVSLCSLTILTALLLQQGCLRLNALRLVVWPVIAQAEPSNPESAFEEATYEDPF